MVKNVQYWGKYGSKLPIFDVCFGPGPVHLQTRVRVRELDPGTRVSDPGLDALILTRLHAHASEKKFCVHNHIFLILCFIQNMIPPLYLECGARRL